MTVAVFINSTIGLGGLFDVASEAGIEKHNEDLGQTLGVWGQGSGWFVMLPILGPSSTRDAFGKVFDVASDPLTFVSPASAGLAARGTDAIDTRAQLLEAGKILHDSVLDPYLFIRDAYLQRRGALVRDGRAESVAAVFSTPAGDDDRGARDDVASAQEVDARRTAADVPDARERKGE